MSELLEDKYDDTFSGKTITIEARECGKGSQNKTKTFDLHFFPYNKKHLIGRSSEWADEKKKAFKVLADYDTGFKMVGICKHNMGGVNDPDLLVGNERCFFGFVDDDERGYVPSTCVQGDIRNYSFSPLYKVEKIYVQ